jgi:phosphate transport system substrate-binding protein
MTRPGIIIVVLCLIISCKRTQRDTDTLTGGLIHIAASDEFEQLIEAEINAFCVHFDSAHIIPTYRTEKDAIRLLTEDSVRFVIASRSLTERETRLLGTKNLAVRRSVIAFDGVALVTNTANPDSLIALSTLKQILRGDITDWSQINPENHAGAIRILLDSQQSGIFRYIVDSLLEKNTEKISPNLYQLGTTANVLKRTSEQPGALGLIASGHIVGGQHSGTGIMPSNTRLVRVSSQDRATVENSSLPYAGDIWAGRYPLWRSVYILVSDPKTGLPTGFAVFIANQIGQKIIQKAGLLPITDAWNIHIEAVDEITGN